MQYNEETNRTIGDMRALVGSYKGGIGISLSQFSKERGRGKQWASDVLRGHSMQKEAIGALDLEEQKWLVAIDCCTDTTTQANPQDVANQVRQWDDQGLVNVAVTKWLEARKAKKSEKNRWNAAPSERAELPSSVRYDPAFPGPPLAGFQAGVPSPSGSGLPDGMWPAESYPPSTVYAAYTHPQPSEEQVPGPSQQPAPSAGHAFVPENYYWGQVNHVQGSTSMNPQNPGPAGQGQYFNPPSPLDPSDFSRVSDKEFADAFNKVWDDWPRTASTAHQFSEPAIDRSRTLSSAEVDLALNNMSPEQAAGMRRMADMMRNPPTSAAAAAAFRPSQGTLNTAPYPNFHQPSSTQPYNGSHNSGGNIRGGR